LSSAIGIPFHLSDGWLYYATDRGSPTVTHDGNGYRGEWVLRTHPKTRETQVVAAFPIAKHTIPASVLDPKRMVFYGGTAPGKDAANQKIQFFALDVKTGKLLKTADDGPYRTLIFSPSTGKVFWEGKAYDPATNQMVTGDIRQETRQVLKNIQRILEGCGATMQDVVKCSVFLSDGNDFAAMNEVYAEFFGAAKPARTTVACRFAVAGMRVEIDAIAYKPAK
jgi:2-iminobutanoate/2-iminopropanoate deaminase